MTATEEHIGTQTEALIDRYLRDQLSGQALSDFELRMLEDSALFDAVERAQQMHQAFKEVAEGTGQHDTLQSASSNQSVTPKNNVMAFSAWIRQPLSMAASVLLVMTASFIALPLGQSPTTSELSSAGDAVNSVVNLAVLRSSSSVMQLAPGRHLLQIDVGIALNNPEYAVTVSSADGNEQYHYRLIPDSNGVLRLLTAESWLGEYRLEVQRMPSVGGETNRSEAQRYVLRFGEE